MHYWGIDIAKRKHKARVLNKDGNQAFGRSIRNKRSDAKPFGHVLSSGVNCRRDFPRNWGSLVLLGKLVFTVFGAAHGTYEVIECRRPTVSSGARRRLGATLGGSLPAAALCGMRFNGHIKLQKNASFGVCLINRRERHRCISRRQ